MAEKDRIINVYDRRVKVTGWNAYLEYFPQDNDPYNSCKRNYFLSTHSRLGSDKFKTPRSETHAMLQQYYESDVVKPKSTTKKYVRESCANIMREGKGVYPLGLMATDYTSTTNYDYRHPFPHLEKPVQLDLSPPPPTHRRIHVGILKLGYSKFLDDRYKLYCKPHLYKNSEPPPFVNLNLYYRDTPEEDKGLCSCNDHSDNNDEGIRNNQFEKLDN